MPGHPTHLVLPWAPLDTLEMARPGAVAKRRDSGSKRALTPCRALSMLASVHRARGFLPAQARAPNGKGPLEAVAAVTSACIGAGGIAEEQAGTWVAEASDMLLDTWAELLYEHSAGFAKYVCLTPWHALHAYRFAPTTSIKPGARSRLCALERERQQRDSTWTPIYWTTA